MSQANARDPGTPEIGPLEPSRLGRAARRDALLDAAVALLVSEEAVSMEAVAERAGVSRPLVYKHFANRGELLAAVYRREAAMLHRELAAEVGSADTVEGMFRALIRGSLRAAGERGHLFTALRSAGGWSSEVCREQRARDADTVRYFCARAARELAVEPRRARAATAMLLGMIDSVLAQWAHDPTADHALLLEDTYMAIVSAGLGSLGGAHLA